MSSGPKGQKRPADVIGNAVHVMRIATGQEADNMASERSKAAELGSRGRAARSETVPGAVELANRAQPKYGVAW